MSRELSMNSVCFQPSSLIDLSIECVCNTVKREFIDTRLDSNISPKYRLFFRDEIFLPEVIAEKLLTAMCKNNILNGVTSPLFNTKSTRLRYVEMPDASQLNFLHLRIFCQHNLKEIQINKSGVPVNEVMTQMNDWTRTNLEKLNVSECCVMESFHMVLRVSVNLEKFKNIRDLDVSRTDFHSHNLVAVVDDLPNLQALNISDTRVDCISPLIKCRHKLKKLGIANLKLSSTSPKIPFLVDGCDEILFRLTLLEHLDVSFERNNQPFNNFLVSEERHTFKIIETVHALPKLVSLDVSGQDNIRESSLAAFLRAHSRMQFLGLMFTNLCNSQVFDPEDPCYLPQLKVSGTGSIEQVILGLKLYEKRCSYVQQCLYSLYTFSESLGSRPDIIGLVLRQMRTHRLVFPIQLAGTACLYNLTKWGWLENYSPGNIPHKLLVEVVSLTLDAMELFPNHFQLQKNALLTLCNDRILQETAMDRFRCAKLVLNTFCAFNNEQTERLCVAISSIIASKISSKETTEIGSDERYMKKLLHIVRRKLQETAIDSTLGFALSTLWNLSDESPNTCIVFLQQGGMRLFTDMLKQYNNVEPVLTKVLGLLNNIAEVEELRYSLMQKEIIDSIRLLLKSNSIEIGYFSGGVFAHLLSKSVDSWQVEDVPRHVVLEELEQAILSWEQANKEMVAYRSFRPFLPLLQCYETYQAQLWALWAIQHVLTAHGLRYSEMLTTEGICDILYELTLSRRTNQLVRSRANTILEQLSDFKARRITGFKF